MVYIMVFSDHWGYVEGGINAFNYDFTLALGEHVRNTDHKIIGVTLVDPPYSLVEIARNQNVEILSLGKKNGKLSLQNDLRLIRRFILELEDLEKIFFVGHDVITGELVNYLSESIGSPAVSIVFHHMDYEAYYSIKGGSTIEEIDNKISYQKSVLNSADHVIGVGPKLEESADAKIPGKALMIIPGMAQITPWKAMKRLVGITFGRYDARTDKLKQMALAVKAFTRFVHDFENLALNDPTLKIIGLSKDEDKDKLKEVYTSEITRYINILPLPYRQDRISLYTELAQSNLCLMLSVHEGFGLVGFEAIAAGVPLILSENSGLYQLLLNTYSRQEILNRGVLPVKILGSNDGKLNEIDLSNVAAAIKTIRENQLEFRQGALKLREEFLKNYTWSSTASAFLNITSRFTGTPRPLPGLRSLPKASNSQTPILSSIYLQSVDSIERHAELWRWNQRTFRHRHPNGYQDFDLVGLELGRSWWKRYPMQDWILKDWFDEQIGTYCLVPISKQKYNDLVSGKIIESDLRPVDIILEKKVNQHQYWYLANFMKARISRNIKSEVSQYASNAMVYHIASRTLTSSHFATISDKEIFIVAFVEARSIRKTVENLRFHKAHPHTNDKELEKVYTANWTKAQIQIMLSKTEKFLLDNQKMMANYQKNKVQAFVQPPNY